MAKSGKKDAKDSKSKNGGKDSTPKAKKKAGKQTSKKAGKKTSKASSDKTTKGGRPRKSELPSTVARSGDKAQRTFATVHDAAAEQYGEEERAYRTAFSALKHTHEKVGDHWEPKESYGPSDQHAAEGRDSTAPTAEGVDANASKQHLYDIAKRLEVPGRSQMSKDQLVEAIVKANRKAAREARS